MYRDNKLLNLFLCNKNYKDTFRKRVISIYGLNFYKSSDEIYINSNDFVLNGIYNIFQKNIIVQVIFINKRIITDNNIVILIIKKFFREFFYKAVSCSYILFLTISNQLVNVNVHPNKNNIEILNAIKICECINKHLLYYFSRNKYFINEYKNFLFIKDKYYLSLNSVNKHNNKKALMNYYIHCFYQKFGNIINIINNRHVLIQKKNDLYITDLFIIYYLYNKYLIKIVNKKFADKILYFSLKKNIKFSVNFSVYSSLLFLLNKIGFFIKQKKNFLYISKIPLFFYNKNCEYLLIQFINEIVQKQIKS